MCALHCLVGGSRPTCVIAGKALINHGTSDARTSSHRATGRTEDSKHMTNGMAENCSSLRWIGRRSGIRGPWHATLMENNWQDSVAGHRSHHGSVGSFIEYKLDAIMMTKNQEPRANAALSAPPPWMAFLWHPIRGLRLIAPLHPRCPAAKDHHLKDLGPWEKGFYLSGLCAPYDCKVAIL